MTQRSFNFQFVSLFSFSYQLYKFGDINNNELLIINLAAVPADRNANTSSSPSRNVVRYQTGRPFMNFEDSIKPLREFLILNSFSIQIEERNLIEFSSMNITIRIAYSPFEKSFIIFIGRKNSLIGITPKDVTEFFNDNTFKFQSTFTVENLIAFLSSSGKALLFGDMAVVKQFEDYSLQQNRIYSIRPIIESANKAWEQKDYASFVKFIEKVDKDLLPPLYIKKYQIAIKKVNT